MAETIINTVSFVNQINDDQKKYSRYVCDSRAIPNEIDGLKPVQRRILWTMWNSVAKNNFTKTVKVAGLVMGYHPHGDSSIQDALSAMAQQFTFANNYAYIQGEGTFGDVLDPKAIASPRYTEVKISDFAKDVGFFESIPDITYVPNYDESTREPVFFVPKIPVVLLNGITGIATGFRCNIPGHRLTDVVDAMLGLLEPAAPNKEKKAMNLVPWYREFRGDKKFWKNENGAQVFTTSFGFEKRDHRFYLVSAPQGWNRAKTIEYLDGVLNANTDLIRDYLDHSTDTFNIELIPKKGVVVKIKELKKLFNKVNNETLMVNIITHEGRLIGSNAPNIISRFVAYRKKHLIIRFKRLAKLEKEKIDRNSELIRFIKEEWNKKVTTIKNKSDFEKKLKTAQFKYGEWLSSIPVYRMTTEEVKKCRVSIIQAKQALKEFKELATQDKSLTGFMVQEITDLKKKWDSHAN